MSRARGSEPAPAIWSTTDVGVAAYLRLNGLELHKITRAGKQNGRSIFGRWHFRDPEGVAGQLCAEYANSAFCRFDQEKRSLTSLVANVRKTKAW